MGQERKFSRREAVKKVGNLSLLTFLDRNGDLQWNAQSTPQAASPASQDIRLDRVSIVVDPGELPFVHHAVKDLADYLEEISGSRPELGRAPGGSIGTMLVVGKKAAQQISPTLLDSRNLGEEGFLIKSLTKDGRNHVIVTGLAPRGTGYGVATLMTQMRAEGKVPFLEGNLDVQSTPRFKLRGMHLNGWPFDYPYAFRAWREIDWQRFIDIIWLEKGNMVFLLPIIEILPVPLSQEDEAYLQEVRRVVDYAQTKRGLEVWIMHSANRVAISDCGSADPRLRQYWVDRCQQDMNPSDPQQLARGLRSIEALYRTVNNADAYCMIDSDPGGWPQSPIREQLEIFKGARALLDRLHVKGTQVRLIDWMHVGWGRHKFFSSSDTVVGQYDWGPQNPDLGDQAFMAETIRYFRQTLPEPWGLLSTFSKYLEVSRDQGTLAKTVFIPYGAIEGEPSVPATNIPLNPVRKVLDMAAEFPELRGVMGNNQNFLVQLPRTCYFLRSAWDFDYRTRGEKDVIRDLTRQLYASHSELAAESFLALEETNPGKIQDTLDRLERFVAQGKEVRPGPLGRFLFPDHLIVARNLVFQLKIRVACQRLLQTLVTKPTRDECEKLVENFLDAVLAWNKETGWGKMVKIGIWRGALYPGDKKFEEAMSILKRLLKRETGATSYADIASFFEPIRRRLLSKYEEDSVMIGCIEPLKMAVIQAS